MSQPTAKDAHYDQLLTNVSTAFIQNQSRFVSTKVFPIVNVDRQTDKYPTFTQNEWFRDEALIRGDNAESAGGGYTLSNDSYYCDVYAYHKDIGDQFRKNADRVYNPDREATEFVTQKILLKQEAKFVSDYFTNVWGTNLVGGVGFTKFSDYAASDPLGVVTTGQETIEQNTGLLPEDLVMGIQVYNKLKNHPDFVDRIKHTSSEAVTLDLMARLFDVKRIHLVRAIKATNVEGATGAYDFFAGKSMLLVYVPPNPGLLTPTAGYTFSWSYAPVGGAVPISRFRQDLKKSDRIEGEAAFDNKLVSTALGYYWGSVVA